MDERYWITKDCIEAVGRSLLSETKKAKLELKLLQLRRELARCKRQLGNQEGCEPYRKLFFLVRELATASDLEEVYVEIWQHAYALLVEVEKEQADGGDEVTTRYNH
ncbi:hypothetical protein [Geomonas agri]|uniref:hypothetical protein n=1 Tax=Geomonas agri TaxID=2873702 RepID=UPI001CD39FC6|nr:hypothetical protein [Geomonas agri]